MSVNQLDKVREMQKQRVAATVKPEEVPKRTSNWNVQKSKAGYYRCYRKLNNLVHCVYIGKTLDVDKAKVRIKEKQKRLRLYNG